MNTVQQIKKILATFLNVEEHTINNDTVIDRSVIKRSIMIHRMYAALSRDLKLEIKDYIKIRTLGDLLEACGLGVDKNASPKALPATKDNTPLKEYNNLATGTNKNLSVGIDMEEVNKMPNVPDFREDAFYKRNFSQKEISYCLLQPDPLQSFAGKFAAKEAIVKADNSYKSVPFFQIEIDTDDNGKPYFMNFSLSISHTDNLAIAVAIRISASERI
jgi:holo-[acyl-carrier protein] synthase